MDEPGFELPNCTGHGLPARIYESHQPDSKNRKFYRCPKPIGDSTRCKYFCWVDEYRPEGNGNAGPSSQSRTLPPTPQSTNPNSARDIMQKDYPQTPTVNSQSKKRSFSSFEEGHEANASPFSSQKRTKFEDDEDFYSQPSTSQNNKSKPAAVNSPWPPRTPPRTYSNGANNFSTPRLSQSFGSQGSGPSASQETLPGTSGNNNEELNADSIAEMLTRLEGTPRLVRKLDRRRIAAEKSRDAKASKIASLEAEVERLKEREKELEAVIAAYEQRD